MNSPTPKSRADARGPRLIRLVTVGFGLPATRQRIEGPSRTLPVESEPRITTAIPACVPTAPVGVLA